MSSLQGDLERAKELLHAQDLSLVLVKDGQVLGTSKREGVVDLLTLVKSLGPRAQSSALADRVVGKAVALIVRHGGISAVYAPLISQAAKAELAKAEVYLEYESLVPFILDKERTGLCPMERLTLELDDPGEAVAALWAFVEGASKAEGQVKN